MEEKLQTTREHTASVLKEMKDSTRRTERTRPPSGNFFYEMHRTPGPRWTKRKDNELLLAIATQPRDTPDFSEIADKLGKKYTPDEVE